MKKGNIGVTTENIFPVIKKFLYSDHEIFLREMVSNAVDATQKLKTLAQQGDFKGDMGDLTIHITLDKDAKTLTISDRGIGMTAEEIDKYINQIAFSGVTDFLEKYKDEANAIIGHFGLGFYSAFMVSDKVEIVTKSYKDGAKAVRWTVTVHQNLRSTTLRRPTADQTLSCTSQTTAKTILSTTRLKNCSTSTASSCPYPSPSERKRNGKTASKWKPTRTPSSIMWSRFGQRHLRH